MKRNDLRFGILQIEVKTSNVDMQRIIYIHSLYLTPEYQNVGFGKSILSFIHKQYSNMRIECECWYGIPASNMFERIGFKPMYIHYYLL